MLQGFFYRLFPRQFLLEKQNASLQAEISERNRLEQKLQAISEEERHFVSRLYRASGNQ